jgi:hypothetical protein
MVAVLSSEGGRLWHLLPRKRKDMEDLPFFPKLVVVAQSGAKRSYEHTHTHTTHSSFQTWRNRGIPTS